MGSGKMIPYGRQSIDERDIRSVIRVLRGELITQGKEVPEFEGKVRRYVGTKHAVAVNSATSGLHLACLALGIGEGDIVWTSPITFVASSNCALYCGAKIDFVDIDPEDGLISPDALSRKLRDAEKRGKLPKLLIVVHLAGSSCAMAEIRALTEKYGVLVIEDASHALGGKYDGAAVGSCRYSDATVFSFHPVKIITSGEGGMVTTNCDETAGRVKALRSHGITKDAREFIGQSDGPWYYEQQQLGYNYRMSDIHAALGSSQMEKLDRFVAERNQIIVEYVKKLEGKRVRILKARSNVYSAYHLAVAIFEDCDKDMHRRIFEEMRNAGIGVQLHYNPVHLNPYYRKLGFKCGDFPKAESYASKAMSIPVYPGLGTEGIDQVCSSINSAMIASGYL